MKTSSLIFITSYIVSTISFISLSALNSAVSALGIKSSVTDEGVFKRRREQMVEEQLASRGIKDKEILDAMKCIPRHFFIPEENRTLSYSDRPVPIGFGQTISQPYVVAFMTELLKVDKDDIVLEVGTGSGYQASVLSRLVKQVYTIEVVEKLGKEAMKNLKVLGYTNVKGMIGDGYKGWPEHAPFDAIIVTASAEHIPQPLIDQLKPGGCMVIPVGGMYAVQDLMLITKDASENIIKKSIIPVRFVPLIRK